MNLDLETYENILYFNLLVEDRHCTLDAHTQTGLNCRYTLHTGDGVLAKHSGFAKTEIVLAHRHAPPTGAHGAGLILKLTGYAGEYSGKWVERWFAKISHSQRWPLPEPSPV